ncbi:MAG: homogentisate 1,2-dioxygenase, partial [Chloroflexota bacterium]
MFYAARGNIPPKRHTQHRAPDGSLYAEELFGVEGFTGRSSLLYHATPPTRTHKIEAVGRIALEAADDGLHRHRLTKTGGLEPHGDVISGRVPLYFNHDV